MEIDSRSLVIFQPVYTFAHINTYRPASHTHTHTQRETADVRVV